MHLFKSSLFVLVLICFMVACGNSQRKPTQLTYVKYVAYRQSDTAMVFLNQSKEIFSGTLMINQHGVYIDSGTVKGWVKGDTLIGEFHYLHYQLEWKRKPVAFLMKNNRLVMGEGLTKMTVGIPHFDPSVPIDFNENKQFVFVKGD
ncbi:hypothetical protein [Pedobacter sp.]|uniref:hypothetical protein n=1 Tax=Pedobacter sp. TaxID=1411316 RepID=UPI0031D47405